MSEKINIKGNENLTVNGNLIFDSGEKSIDIDAYFSDLDSRLKKHVVADGNIVRGNTTISYSSEALFTSLVRIGMPVNAAIVILRDIIPILAEQVSEKEKKH